MIVFEVKGHMAIFELHDSAFCDHRAFGVATGISDRFFCTLKRRTNENMPAFLTNVSQELVNIDAPPSVFSKTPTKQCITLMSFSDCLDDVQLPLGSKKGSRNEISFGC